MDRVSSHCSQKTSVQSTGNHPPHAETLELNCAEQRTLQLRKPCVLGKSSHFHSAEKQCSKWLGYCSRRWLPGLIRSWSLAAFAGRDTTSSLGAASEHGLFLLLLFLNQVKEWSWYAVTLTVSFCIVWLCVLQGSARCTVLCWTSAVRFVAFFYGHIWQCLNRGGA